VRRFGWVGCAPSAAGVGSWAPAAPQRPSSRPCVVLDDRQLHRFNAELLQYYLHILSLSTVDRLSPQPASIREHAHPIMASLDTDKAERRMWLVRVSILRCAAPAPTRSAPALRIRPAPASAPPAARRVRRRRPTCPGAAVRGGALEEGVRGRGRRGHARADHHPLPPRRAAARRPGVWHAACAAGARAGRRPAGACEPERARRRGARSCDASAAPRRAAATDGRAALVAPSPSPLSPRPAAATGQHSDGPGAAGCARRPVRRPATAAAGAARPRPGSPLAPGRPPKPVPARPAAAAAPSPQAAWWTPPCRGNT
jgi:hypothetical protein